MVTDNMKTAVLGRDEQRQPIWNPAYQQLAVEFKFHPYVCAPASGNQKGSVENLVLCRHLAPLRTFVWSENECPIWKEQVIDESPTCSTEQCERCLVHSPG